MESNNDPQFETAWVPAVKAEPCWSKESETSGEEDNDVPPGATHTVKQEPGEYLNVILHEGGSSEVLKDETKIQEESTMECGSEIREGTVGSSFPSVEIHQTVLEKNGDDSEVSEEVENNKNDHNEEQLPTILKPLIPVEKKKKVWKRRKHQCILCGKIYSRKMNLTEHLLVAHTGKRYDCTICPKSYTSKSMLKRHLEVHRGVTFSCPQCPKSFISKVGFREHKRMHAEGIYRCSYCDKSYCAKRRLDEHLKTHEEGRYTCHLCLKSYAFRNSLDEHIRSHEAVLYPCTLCEKTFKNKPCLNRHQRVHQTTSYSCVTCGKTYRGKRHLKEHIKTHSDGRYGCPVCSKSYSLLQGLKDHMRIHVQQQYALHPGFEEIVVKCNDSD